MRGRYILKAQSIVFLIMITAAFFDVALLPAQSAKRLNIDLNRADSIKLRATIMEIDAAGGILIVAEKEIHIVDLVIDGHQFKTELRNAQGKSVPLESFHVGKRVHVEGIEFERDRVAASVIQHIQHR